MEDNSIVLFDSEEVNSQPNSEVVINEALNNKALVNEALVNDEITSDCSSPIDVSEPQDDGDDDVEPDDEPPMRNDKNNDKEATEEHGEAVADESRHDNTEVIVEEQTEMIEDEADDQPTSADTALTSDRLIKFPLARIKNIMKTDPDVTMASQETALLIAKATELFIQELSRELFSYTAQAKRRTIQRKDLELAIDHTDSFAFLEGTLDT